MYSKDEIYEKSIILIGTIGVGKTLISNALGKETGLPVITADLLRGATKTQLERDEKKQRITEKLDALTDILSLLKNEEKINKIKNDIVDQKNGLWAVQRDEDMSAILPNIHNYHDFGYNKTISKFLDEAFGSVAWHFYEKRFENFLVEEIFEQIDRPCIFDMGGGMAISLDDEYKKLEKQFRAANNELFDKYFDMSKIDFEYTKSFYAPFKNVIYLQLSNNKEEKSTANLDNLNELFIKSKQFDEISKYKISTDGLISNNGVNKERVQEIVSEICTISNTPRNLKINTL